MSDPYGCSMRAMFGARNGPSRHYWRVAHHLAPYSRRRSSPSRGNPPSAMLGDPVPGVRESPRFDAAVMIGRLLRIPVFGAFKEALGIGRAGDACSASIRRSAGLVIGAAAEADRVKTRTECRLAKCGASSTRSISPNWQPMARHDIRRDLGIGGTTRVAIWHGRVDIRRKGLDVLLEAWRGVDTTRPDRISS